MTMMKKILVGATGLAALATAAPSVAQYGNAYSYGYGQNRNITAVAAQQCSAAVQNRLYYQRQNNTGVAGILGAVLGANTQSTGRVLSITQVVSRNNSIRVRGLATSGRNAGYGAYGYGAYGAAGYAYQPDLSFRCDIDYRGHVRYVDINRR